MQWCVVLGDPEPRWRLFGRLGGDFDAPAMHIANAAANVPFRFGRGGCLAQEVEPVSGVVRRGPAIVNAPSHRFLTANIADEPDQLLVVPGIRARAVRYLADPGLPLGLQRFDVERERLADVKARRDKLDDDAPLDRRIAGNPVLPRLFRRAPTSKFTEA